MKDNRLGDWLWEEWDGEGYDSSDDSVASYFTHEWVDLSNEIIKRALASCLQRDGVADSLSDGFNMIEKGRIVKAYAGYLEDEESALVLCDDAGETYSGDLVDNVVLLTLVEVRL